MKLLLDTHIVLWWFADDRRLPLVARTAIADRRNELFVSAVVGYEIAYKQRLGQLPPLPAELRDRFLREGMNELPISLDHAVEAAMLPGPHRDPWDRIMMAQAATEAMHMVTVDPVFRQYGVRTLA